MNVEGGIRDTDQQKIRIQNQINGDQSELIRSKHEFGKEGLKEMKGRMKHMSLYDSCNTRYWYRAPSRKV